MQTLRITHTTKYSYSEPVTFGRHRLVLRPREGHDLRVESFKLHITPEHDVAWTRDVFGNNVALVDFLEPAAKLTIENEVHLLRHSHPRRKNSELHRPVPFPVVYDPLESAVAAAYRATTYGEESAAVQHFLAQHKLQSAPDHDAEFLLDRLNKTLHKTIKYNRRPEKGTQSPARTLEKQAGSCRDIATLMMEACRALGIAARFASGYLDCPASTAGHASTHAWTEVYLPSHGWIAYDPTIGEHCSHKHIPCGLSNHPRGVMPVSGTYTPTATSQYHGLSVAVHIERL
jgi:transglutaminase-like putative cysteine protease